MPRPTDEGLVGQSGGGFGSPANAGDLGQIDVSTIHQLDVDGATENAKLLAAVFDKAGAIGTKMVDNKISQDNKQQSALGAEAGLTGDVDQSKMDNGQDGGIFGASSAYANGVKRSQTQLAAYTTSEKARALFAQNPNASLLDSTDSSGNNVPGLMSQVDSLFAKDFPLGTKDPVVANIVAPIMQHTLNEITAQSYQHKIINDQQTAEDSAQASAMHDITYGSSLFNATQQLDTLTKVYGGNNRLGRDALIHAVGEAAAATGNPQAITKYLPPGIDFGNGATLTPENQAYLDAATTRATETQNRNNAANAKNAANSIADMMLAGKDPKAALHQYFQMPGAQAQEGLDMYNWYYRQGKEKEQDAVDNSHTTWDMDRATATGDITSGGQLLSWLTTNGVGNTALGNKMFQRGMANIRSFQNTNADDPDFRAGMSNISQTYSPAQNKMTGKFLNDSANSQQAGALLDYRTLYNQYLRQPNTSATDAARKAQASVREKWGDPVEDANGNLKSGAWKAPESDVDQAEVIRNAVKNPVAFHAANIRPADIDSLQRAGMIAEQEAKTALQLYIQSHQHK